MPGKNHRKICINSVRLADSGAGSGRWGLLGFVLGVPGGVATSAAWGAGGVSVPPDGAELGHASLPLSWPGSGAPAARLAGGMREGPALGGGGGVSMGRSWFGSRTAFGPGPTCCGEDAPPGAGRVPSPTPVQGEPRCGRRTLSPPPPPPPLRGWPAACPGPGSTRRRR